MHPPFETLHHARAWHVPPRLSSLSLAHGGKSTGCHTTPCRCSTASAITN
ncbi:hypothetical protein AO826_16335 [Xanthomonas phaseoli pv. manihotis]|nr:hypothetical protein AO826_16335 [Xanthomonas phaseoli pv. manihotis]